MASPPPTKKPKPGSSGKITGFFAPKSRGTDDPETTEKHPQPEDLDDDEDNSSSGSELETETERGHTSESPQPQTADADADPRDVGTFIDATGNLIAVSDDIKMALIRTIPYDVPAGFEYPYEERQDKRQGPSRRYLRKHHFTKYPHCAYSLTKKGILCVPCVLFADRSKLGGRAKVQGGDQAGASCVTRVEDRFARIDKHLQNHNDCSAHKDSLTAMENFVETLRHPERTIANQLVSSRLKQAMDNRKRLIPILMALEFIARRGIALRGHRDDGRLLSDNDDNSMTGGDRPTDDNSSAANEGNFRALLKFMVKCGRTDLEQHLKGSSSVATYVSKTIQNEFIGIMGHQISSAVAASTANSGVFTVICDETTDTSRKEQMSLCLRYVGNSDQRDPQLREDFIGYVHVKDLTGRGLCAAIADTLTKHGLDTKHCIGQGYDGASAMSGKYNGVQALFRNEHAPCALYVHCFSHCLNLIISKSSALTDIRNAFGCIASVAEFFNSSAHRVQSLLASLKEGGLRYTKIKFLCARRWVERHEAIIRFKGCYEQIVQTMSHLSRTLDADSSAKATCLLKSIQTPEFVVSLCILAKILSATKPLSQCLQQKENELILASDDIKTVVGLLQSWRDDAAGTFRPIFGDATKLYNCRADAVNATDRDDDADGDDDDELDEIPMPRRPGRQRNKANVPATSPEEFYRRSIYIPYLDQLLTFFAAQFATTQFDFLNMLSLVPHFMSQYDVASAEAAVEFYAALLPHDSSPFATEYERWQTKWRLSDQGKSDTALDALATCNQQLFPRIHKLLQIFVTLPVTSSTAEISFSTLRYLKNLYRSTMAEDRLNGLALMYIHRHIPVNFEAAIDVFAQKSRKRDFVL